MKKRKTVIDQLVAAKAITIHCTKKKMEDEHESDRGWRFDEWK